MRILFVAGFGPIVRGPASAELYRETLGISFKEEDGGYLHTEDLPGAKTFALWPLEQAAESCFGTATWPAGVPEPQAWLEFDVEDLTEATSELEAAGHRVLVREREEPWGQKVTRLLSPEGLLLGLTVTPWMRG